MDITNLTAQWQSVKTILLRFRLIVAGCVAIFGLGGLVVAALTPKAYQAHQPFLIRDETSTHLLTGKFQSLEWLKSAQETIQEVAKHPDVLRAAMQQVGPASGFAKRAQYPSETEMESFRDSVWISSPGGNELGRSEIIHLNVRAESRERALRLTQLISDGISRQMRIIRTQRAASIEAELAAAVESAECRVKEVTKELVEMEKSLGEDLIELRSMMDDKVTSDSALLKPFLLSVDAELLICNNSLQRIEQDIAFFQQAEENLSNLLGLPNDLLEQYQSLKELRTSLVTAQIAMADVMSKYRPGHVRYVAAETRLRSLESQIRQELHVSIENAGARRVFVESRARSLSEQRVHRIDQLKRLAELRTPYQTLTAIQLSATNSLKTAQAELAQARAARLAASQIDLLTPMEEAQAATRSVGLSRSLIAIGAVGCGLFVGLGLMMFLAAQPTLASPIAISQWQSDQAAP